MNGKCKWCGSDKVVKNGMNQGRQLYKCKDCNHQFFDNGKFPRMRNSKEAVAFAMETYFDGHSLPKIAKNLRKFLKTNVSFQEIWQWIQKFVPKVDDYLSQFQPQLSGIWHVDETAIKFRPQNPLTPEQRMKHVRRIGQQYWHWDAIDEGTRYLVDSHVSRIRSRQEAIVFFKECKANSPRPVAIVTDELPAYPIAANKVFYSHFKDRRVEHIHTKGFGARMNNQIVERWHGTLKDRTKAMRGLVSPETMVLKGFGIQYNFLRTHSTLRMTPAEAAQIHLPFENGWGDLIRWSTNWETLRTAGNRTSNN
jgi:transposase-like protein